MAYRKSKYHSQKVEIDGILFDSKREANRYRVLKEKAEMGQITSLERQVKFILIPVQKEPDRLGPRGGMIKGKVLERECSYIADFTYYDQEGNYIVEDTKGFRTPEYIIKRKMMLYLKGIRITEI
jgi:hypothetical protein